MKRAALYLRVSTLDQHPETQLYDLRTLAQQRSFQIVAEYTDRISARKRAALVSTNFSRMPAAASSMWLWSGLVIASPARFGTISKCSMN